MLIIRSDTFSDILQFKQVFFSDSPVTLAPNDKIFVESSTGSIVFLIPPFTGGSGMGTTIRLIDCGDADIHPFTITPQSNHRIMGGPLGDSLVINEPHASITLVFNSDDSDWRIV